MLDDAKRAFLVAPPDRLGLDYQPDISDDEVDFLQLTNPSDAFLLNIVTLRRDGDRIALELPMRLRIEPI